MNKLILLALAVIGTCALVQAGKIEDKDVLDGAKKAFSNINFFSDLIQRNKQEAPVVQPRHENAFEKTRGQFQKSIDANKNAPIPHPMNKEVDVYLHDGVDGEEDEELPADHEDVHEHEHHEDEQ